MAECMLHMYTHGYNYAMVLCEIPYIRIVLEIIYEHIKLYILANFKAPIKRYVTFIYAINMFRLV